MFPAMALHYRQSLQWELLVACSDSSRPFLCSLVSYYNTVDREIFTLKIVCIKNFRVDKFSWFRSIHEIFLTINNYNMDEHLDSSKHLVYYQVTGEPGIAGYSRRSDIYLGGCRLHVHTYSLIIALFSRVKFSRLVSTTKLF